MPIYEYACHACDHRLEKLQKISDVPLTDCPACGQPGLRKLVSAAAFRLKGGGWYETDFKDEPSRRNVLKDDDKSSAKPAGDKGADGGKKKKEGADKDAGAKPGAPATGAGAAPAAPAG